MDGWMVYFQIDNLHRTIMEFIERMYYSFRNEPKVRQSGSNQTPPSSQKIDMSPNMLPVMDGWIWMVYFWIDDVNRTIMGFNERKYYSSRNKPKVRPSGSNQTPPSNQKIDMSPNMLPVMDGWYIFG
jgi:hypothetical protein